MAATDEKVLVSPRNEPLLRYGDIMSFHKLPPDVQMMIRSGNVGVAVQCNVAIDPRNVKRLEVDTRRFWYGQVPMDELKALVFQDDHACCAAHPKREFPNVCRVPSRSSRNTRTAEC